MALNQWRAVLTDLSYTPVGELQNADERVLTMTLNRIDTASFKIRTDNPLADLAQSLDCYLKLYRNNQLMFFGLLQTSEESVGAEGGTISCSAAAPGWDWPRRYPVRQANAGFAITGSRAAIANALLQNMNHQYPEVGPGINLVWFEKTQGETGVAPMGSMAPGGTIQYFCPPYKPFSEVLAELSNAADGFDWRITPFENWVGGVLIEHPSYGSYKAAEWRVGAPIGTTRPEAIFEFGTGRLNISSYTRTRSRESQANGITHLLNGQPEDNPIIAEAQGDEDRTKVGILEDIVQADLTTSTLRQQLVNEHLAVRENPRDIVQWTPIADYGDGRLPRYGIDYDLGDFVTGRARSNGSTRFNGQFRVWGVEFSIDKAGIETPKITLEYSG